MKKNHLLIIGSNSFSGSSFANFALNKNLNVIGISRSVQPRPFFLKYNNNENIKRFKFFKVNINKNLDQVVNIISKYRPSFILNFAAQGMVEESWNNPTDWYITNFLSTVKIIEEIKKFKFIKKFINFTTPEVYGSTDRWIKENFSFNPSTPYALSRAAIDFHLNLTYKTFNFPVIFTRTANVYGPHQQLYRIIPKAIIYFLKKKELKLHGGGKSYRSFIHIDDVSRALYMILKKGKLGDTYHISTNKLISIKKLVNMIGYKITKNLSYKKKIKSVSDRVGKDKYYKLNSFKLRSKIGWKPIINLNYGIDTVVEWLKKNKLEIERSNLNYLHKK